MAICSCIHIWDNLPIAGLQVLDLHCGMSITLALGADMCIIA